MAVYPPAGRGNAGRFTPLPDGGTPIAMRRFTPLPDGGTPGGLPPAGRGNADIGMWRFTPLPDGGTPILE